MKVVIKEHNIKKMLNDIAYVEFDDKDDTVDYCLGSDLRECGEICRQLLSYRKQKKQQLEKI